MDKSFYTLITGASRGFGKALAAECAGRNMNLILVALPGEGLPDLATHLKITFGVDVIAMELDLCEEGSCQQLFYRVKSLNLQVNMLVNNAGIGSTVLFQEGCLQHYEMQIRLNVLATTTITHLFTTMLKQNAPSYILNVGSLACFFSLQKKQVYGATKSFICYFSKSLRRELKKDGVFVSVLCPGGMYTNTMAKQTIETGCYLSRASSMVPEDVAPIAMDGLLQKKEVIVPGTINQVILFLDRIVPRFVVRFFEERTMKRLHTPPPAAEQKAESNRPVFVLSTPANEKVVSTKKIRSSC